METSTPEPTYENVAPLLVRAQVNGTSMEYVFRCPATGAEVTGVTQVAPYTPSVAQMAAVDAGVEAKSEVEDRADRLFPGASLIAGVANDVFRWRRQRKQQPPSAEATAAAEENQRQMLLSAFQSVADQFRWDPAGARWVATSR